MIQGQQCNMVMTSVSGHLLGLDFDERHRKWYSCEPIQLFEATLVKTCVDKNMINIKVNYIFGFCKKHIFLWRDRDAPVECMLLWPYVCIFVLHNWKFPENFGTRSPWCQVADHLDWLWSWRGKHRVSNYRGLPSRQQEHSGLQGPVLRNYPAVG